MEESDAVIISVFSQQILLLYSPTQLFFFYFQDPISFERILFYTTANF